MAVDQVTRNQIGKTTHTVLLYALALADSSKEIIRGVPTEFMDVEILEFIDKTHWE